MSADDELVERIKEIVAADYGCTVDHLIGHRRARGLVHARHMAMYLSRTMTSLSLPSIGRHFGDRHHTTVMHAIRVMGVFIERVPGYRERLERLRDEVKA